MNLKLFTAALLATGATAAWTAEDFDALSEAFSNQLLESLQKELNVKRRFGASWSETFKSQHGPWAMGTTWVASRSSPFIWINKF